MPLPVNRRPSASRSASTMTYGDYFQSAADFLARHLATMVNAFMGETRTDKTGAVVQDADIHLVKHGAFYHPAKITVRTDQGELLMALNVAAAPRGRALMDIETTSLRRLSRHAIGRNVIPRILAQGEGNVPGKPPASMFAVQWFDGYCEFHICADQERHGNHPWKVWDENGAWWMTQDQVAGLYRGAAFILTVCYHPLTFEAVLDWHHAAGDFILKRNGRDVEVRLITVRRYAPLCDLPADEGVTLTDILDALVVFLLDLTLRMRLDRLDGTGPLVWAEDRVVPHVWRGFVQGLGRMAALLELPVDFVDGVFHYLAAHSVDDLVDLGRSIAARSGHLSGEAALIQKHLAGHASLLRDLIEQHGVNVIRTT